MYNTSSTVEMLMALDGPAVIDGKARYWSKIAILPQIGGSLSKHCGNVWYRKNVAIPDGDKMEDTLFVSTEYCR